MNCNYGFFADVDKESETLRFLGSARFEVYGHLKLLFLNTYNLKIYFNENEPLPDLTQEQLDDQNFQFKEG